MVHFPDRMKHFGLVAVLLLFVQISVESSLLDPVIENVRHIKATHPPDNVSGMWRKKMLWKPRWIKEWKSSNVLKPIWKKLWGPVIIREWVPIPKPPPHWDSHFGSSPGDAGFHNPSTFLNVGSPPEPNLTYLPSLSTSGGHSGGHTGGYTGGHTGGHTGGYVYKPPKKPFPAYSSPGQSSFFGSSFNPPIPRLPLASVHNSPAETYKGQSSYGGNVDSTAFDLNPPVEKYNPTGYDYKPPASAHLPFEGPQQSGHQHSPFFPKPQHISHSHHAHHYHQHHQHPSPLSHAHSHPSTTTDLSKFPPNWNSWKPLSPNTHSHASSSLVQQASSAVSVVSPVRSTTASSVHSEAVQQTLGQGFKPSSDGFIQPAQLVSEYHYSESGPPSTTLQPVLETSSAAPPHQLAPSTSPPFRQPILVASHTPIPHGHPTSTPAPPRHPPKDKPSPVHHQVPLVHNNHVAAPTSGSVVTQRKPHHDNIRAPVHLPQKSGTKQQTKPHFPKAHVISINKFDSVKAPPHVKVPDFKALPADTVETFHFVDAFPSNESLTRAALLGKPNSFVQSPRLNQVEIVTPKAYKKAPLSVASLAKAVVQEHMKNLQRAKDHHEDHQGVEQSAATTTTEKMPNTVVISTTSSSIRKTLKAYLADEANPNKTTGIFVVTPTPQSSS